MNGEYTISAELRVTGGRTGEETISSNAVTVAFDNDDAWAVTADLGDNSAVGDDGGGGTGDRRTG